MIQEDVTKLLNGELEDSKVSELTAKLSDEAKKSLSEAVALRKERNSVAESLKADKEAKEKITAELKEAEERFNSLKKNTSQFRQEQIDKAKQKFFSDKGIKPEQQGEYTELFGKLDSGKVDPELIYKDLVRVHAALNADKVEEAEALRKQAELATLNAAGRQQTITPGKETPKYSDEVVKYAREAGISEEAAQRQLTSGMKRIREF